MACYVPFSVREPTGRSLRCQRGASSSGLVNGPFAGRWALFIHFPSFFFRRLEAQARVARAREFMYFCALRKGSARAPRAAYPSAGPLHGRQQSTPVIYVLTPVTSLLPVPDASVGAIACASSHAALAASHLRKMPLTWSSPTTATARQKHPRSNASGPESTVHVARGSQKAENSTSNQRRQD